MKTNKAKEIVERALDSLVESLEKGQSEVLKRYFETMSRFHNYILRNIMLIAMQRPQATQVAGFHAWRKLGRYVQKGERGIAIVAPLVYKEKPEDDNSNEGGTSVKGYKVVYVFDVCQTDGQELAMPSSVQGDPSEYAQKLDEFIASQGIALHYIDSTLYDGKACGGEILIRKDLSPAEDFSVKVHELTHEFLHYPDENYSKAQVETEAEAVAFVVSRACGLDANTAFSDYIQMYRGDKETLMNSIQRIKDTSSRILEALGKRETKFDH